jgi:hypothetical protein
LGGTDYLGFRFRFGCWIDAFLDALRTYVLHSTHPSGLTERHATFHTGQFKSPKRLLG